MGNSKKKIDDVEENLEQQNENTQTQEETADNQESCDDLQEQIKSQAEQIEKLKDAHLRLMAEYDNYKKRTAREKENIMFDAVCSCMAKILPVMDSLKMAAMAKTDDTAYKSGVELVLKSFDQALEKLNVVSIDALNKQFDPTLHNAVMHVEDDSFGQNEIIEVLLDGYMMGDRVVRHAMVKVAN